MREAEGRQVWRCNNFLFSGEFWKHSALQRSYSPSPWSRQKYTWNCQRSSQSPQNRLPGALLYCFPDTYSLGGCYTALKKKVMPWKYVQEMFTHSECVGKKWQNKRRVCVHTHAPEHTCPHMCAKYTPKCQQCFSLMVNIRMIFKTVFLDTDMKNRL